MSKNKNQTKTIEICQYNQILNPFQNRQLLSKSVSNGFFFFFETRTRIEKNLWQYCQIPQPGRLDITLEKFKE